MASVIKSIQRVSITVTSGSGTATISAVANAVVWLQGNTSSNTGNVRYNQASGYVQLTNSTTVTATCGSSAPTMVLDAVVVEFASGVNSIQSGTIAIASGTSSNTATLGTAVGPNAFVLYNGFTSNSGLISWESISPSVVLTNSTTVTAATGGTSGITTVAYTVVDLDSSIVASVAAYALTDATSNSTYTQTISSVTPANTLLIYNGVVASGGATPDIQHTIQLTAPTTVTATRNGSNTASRTIYFTVLELQSSVLSATAVQRGTVSISGATSGTATLGTAVNLSFAFCNWNGEQGPETTINQTFATQQLTDGSTVTSTFNAAPTGMGTAWEVVEFSSGGGGQTVILTQVAAVWDGTAVLVNQKTMLTFALQSWQWNGAGMLVDQKTLIALTQAAWGWLTQPLGVSGTTVITLPLAAWKWLGNAITVNQRTQLALVQAAWQWIGQAIVISPNTHITLARVGWAWIGHKLPGFKPKVPNMILGVTRSMVIYAVRGAPVERPAIGEDS